MQTNGHIPALEILHALRHLLRGYAAHTGGRPEQRLGITSAQFTCLQVIAERDQMTQVELAHWTDVSQSALVGHLDRLEAKGLVRRERDAEDRRRIHVHATDAGREAILDAPLGFQQRVGRAISLMPGPEQEAAAGALAHMIALLNSKAVDPATPSKLQL